MFSSGISSLVFTKDAEALYLHSSSELQRLSLSAQMITSARCYLDLPNCVRETTASDTGSVHEEAEKQSESLNQPPLVNGTSESKESSVADKV